MAILPWDDGPRSFSLSDPGVATAPVGDQPEAVNPSFTQTIGAAFRQSNEIASLLASRDSAAADRFRVDDDFDLYKSLQEDGIDDDEPFLDVFNRKAYEGRKAQVTMEREDRRTLEAAGVFGMVADFGAAVASPTTFLPGGAIYRGARLGASVGRSALSVGGAAVGATAIQETALQGTQQLRTGQETAFALGGSAILGGLLGGGVGAYIGRAEARALSRRLDDLARSNEADETAENEAAVRQMLAPGSAGAAATRVETLEENTVAGVAAGAVSRMSAAARLNPLVRLAESPSALVRSAANGLIENPLYLKKNFEGVASDPAIETLVKETNGALATVLTETRTQYRVHRKTGGALTEPEFRKAVGMAMRREEGAALDEGQQPYPPEVMAAAKAWRSTVFDPLKEQAIETGLLPADVDVKTAASYFSRQWNWKAIEQNESQFRGVVGKWVRATVEAEVERLAKGRDARKAKIEQEIADLELPAEERARLLDVLPAELKKLQEGNPQFLAIEDRLRPLREQEYQARAVSKNAAQAEQLRSQIKQIVDAAGKDYADYVSRRNLLQTRIRRIRDNIVGREGKVEQLRARIADTEAANVDRLWRMHRSLALLEQRIDRASPEKWEAELSALRTDFAQVLERSNKARARLEQARATRPESEALAKQGDQFEAAEGKRLAEMNNLAEEIGRLEDIDPEEAVANLRMLIERRTSQAAEVVENAGKRIQDLIRRTAASDPELAKARATSLRSRLDDIDRRFADRVEIRLDGENDYEAYTSEIVDSIYNQLTGRGNTDAPRDLVPVARGPLKERTFNIPDKLVEAFLESDVELVGRRYARIMSAEIELARKFGSPDMKETLNAIEADYARRRAALSADPAVNAETKAKELARLNTREKRDKRDLEAIRDMLRRTYLARENAAFGSRVLAVANTWNYLRSMGGVTLSSLTDIARPMMVHGLGRYMARGVVPLVTNIKAIKLSAKESRYAGIAERILNSRMATLAEIADPYSQSSPFERFMENVAVGFSKLTLMPLWNDWQKLFASAITQDRVLEGVERFGKIKATERAYLAYLGIDEDMANRIARQFAAYGDTDGIRLANTEDWDDPVAVRAFRAAINKDVDSIIVTKGVGDVPLWQHTPLGRTVLQFKSFALASHQRAFMRGLQAAELGVDGGRAGQLAGLISSAAIGMFIYWLKSVESNRTEDLSDNPGRWIAEGVDRSGLFSVAFEVNNTMEKAFGIGAYAALQSLFPDKEQSGKASRYMVRSVTASFTGPTGDFVDTLAKVANSLTNGDLKESDVNAIRRLAPGGTLPGIRSVLEYGIVPEAREAVAD